MHVQVITYNISSSDKKYFFGSIVEPEKLIVPDEVKDHIGSFGSVFEYDHFRKIQREPGILFCNRLKELFETHWKLEYGIPVFRFIGDTDNIGEIFKSRHIFIFSQFNCPDLFVVTDNYRNVLPEFTKITFLAEPILLEMFRVVTTEHKEAYDIIDQMRHIERQKLFHHTKYNFAIRMNNWYPDRTERENLIRVAKDTIDTFVYVKRFGIYIPEFLITPAFHIQRYNKCQQLIKEKYHPYLVMTLPMQFKNSMYTILFPINEKF